MHRDSRTASRRGIGAAGRLLGGKFLILIGRTRVYGPGTKGAKLLNRPLVKALAGLAIVLLVVGGIALAFLNPPLAILSQSSGGRVPRSQPEPAFQDRSFVLTCPSAAASPCI
jgi:hypothetical protein